MRKILRYILKMNNQEMALYIILLTQKDQKNL